MADSIRLVTLPTLAGKTLYNGKNSLIVQCDDSLSDAEVKALVKAYYNDDDSSWDDIVITTIPAAAWAGWECTINIYDTDGTTLLHTVSDTGISDDTSIDSMGARLAAALNGLAAISGAAYTAATNTLIIAEGSGVDNLGDKIVTVAFTPPSNWYDQTINPAGMVGTITDEGSATDDLSVVFTVVSPPRIWGGTDIEE